MAQSIHLVGGIKSALGKFWNCEKFNYQLTSNAALLRQKQTFVFEPTEDGKWRIKSWLNKYLSAHDLGEVTIKTDAPGASETFTLEFLNGLVAIKAANGKYISADENNINAKAAAVGDREKFEIVFGIHPQVVIRSFEGRYVRVEQEEAIANKEQQFGVTTLLTLEYEGLGKYAIKATNGKYLGIDGPGVVRADRTAKSEKELFSFEFVQRKLAFKAANGKYLSPDGAKGSLKTKNDKITPRELFEIFHSDPQINVKAHNNKYVSCQEKNIMCNRTTVGDDETFILEHIKESTYAIRTVQAKYWTCKEGALVVDTTTRGETEAFVIGYSEGKTTFRSAPNKDGKQFFITAKSLGGVRGAAVPTAGDQEVFEVSLLNRPLLVLRTKQLAYLGTTGDKIMANKSASETFTLHFQEGKYLLKNAAGNFLSIGAGDVVTAVPNNQTPLFVEFINGRISFKTGDGRYLISDDQGNFVAGPKKEVPPPEGQFEF